MDELTKNLLRDAGFESTTVSEFLDLNETQEAIVETKVHLTALLRQARKDKGWSQAQLAEAMDTRQQVVARIEKGNRSVTLDMLFRALLALGARLGDIAQELILSEQFLEEQRGERQVELVEVAPISKLVTPERLAANNVPRFGNVKSRFIENNDIPTGKSSIALNKDSSQGLALAA